MKVLMTELFLPESVYTLELCRELKSYADITVFCRENAAAGLDGVKWIDGFYRGGKSKLTAAVEYWQGLRALKTEIRSGDYDIVHVQGFKNAAYEIPLYLREKKHAGMLVHTVHNLLPHEASGNDRKLYGDFYRSCDLLAVHNEVCRAMLIDEYGINGDRIVVTPHGSYTGVRKAADAVRTDDRIHFLQFGIIRRYKGVDILLEAAAMLPEEIRKKIHITIAGAQFPKLDGTDYAEMIKGFGAEDCTELRIGHVPEAELGELFGQADFCLFPYREIYGSGALLMAYSFNKPVLASDIPVFREETDDGAAGLLYAPCSPKALSEAMVSAVSMSADRYSEYQSNICRLVMDKYNWKHSAALLAGAYDKIWQSMKSRENRIS